jgi:hypothetical protein
VVKPGLRAFGLSAAIGLIAVLGLASCSPKVDAPATQGGPLAMRRLTEAQYRQTIADIFGVDIKVAGRFEPDLRKSGLLAVGASDVSVTRAGFEDYDLLAHSIAAQVVDEKHRQTLVPCVPASAKAPDAACATRFFQKVGRLVLRRPLDAQKVMAMVEIADAETKTSGNFYSGLEFVLAGLLEAPEFLFRVDVAAPDTGHPDSVRLDGFSKATRLSFLLWDTTPDDALLAAAENGELDNRDGLTRQVDRMLGSPRLDAGVRAFFSDMLGFDELQMVEKDRLLYPRFSRTLVADAEEQTLRTIADQLIVQHADYRDLFTTRQTFMTRTLGLVYRVPVRAERGWEPFEFPKDDPRAGILTHISFLALHGPSGRSSPTLRGKAVRELLMCQHVPAPPGNVSFALVEDTKNAQLKTVRDRLTAHRVNPGCAGCHRIMDPLGLGLENFDGLGQYRADENGTPIDASGELDGAHFQSAESLGRAMHDNPAVVSCLVNSVYRYAAGRLPQPGEKEFLAWLQQNFAQGGYQLPDLLRRIALSDAFYAISPSIGSKSPRTASGASDPQRESKS